jgi:hypothetical protein
MPDARSVLFGRIGAIGMDENTQALIADIDWFLRHVDKWAVNPSKYRKEHQTTLLMNAKEARKSLQALKAALQETPERER